MAAARLPSRLSRQPLPGSLVSPGSSCRGCEMWCPQQLCSPIPRASVWDASGPGFLLVQHVLRAPQRAPSRASVCAVRSCCLFPSEITTVWSTSIY